MGKVVLSKVLFLMRLNSPLLPEHEILGERVQQRQRDKRKTVNPDTLVRNLAELKLGSRGAFRSWCWALWWLSDTRYWGIKSRIFTDQLCE